MRGFCTVGLPGRRPEEQRRRCPVTPRVVVRSNWSCSVDQGFCWWARQESNLRPAGYEPAALPLSYGPQLKLMPGRWGCQERRQSRVPDATGTPKNENGRASLARALPKKGKRVRALVSRGGARSEGDSRAGGTSPGGEGAAARTGGTSTGYPAAPGTPGPTRPAFPPPPPAPEGACLRGPPVAAR